MPLDERGDQLIKGSAGVRASNLSPPSIYT